MTRKTVIRLNYLYFILVDCLAKWICGLLLLVTIPLWLPFIVLGDLFSKTYTQKVIDGEINLWVRTESESEGQK